MSLSPPLRMIDVGGIPVADLSRSAVVAAAAKAPSNEARTVYALHVGGLVARRNVAYATAMSRADLVYADGAAVVLLARVAGARMINRSATTDIGIPVICAVAERLGRPARVALLGGPPGLAERAGTALARQASTAIVYTGDGYFTDERAPIDALTQAEPDVIVVGLGMPKEALWVTQHKHELPPAIIMTCGGWFGFLAEEERRAPALLQRAGLEWSYRLRQDFRRLVGRYTRGALVTAGLIAPQLLVRLRAGNRAEETS